MVWRGVSTEAKMGSSSFSGASREVSTVAGGGEGGGGLQDGIHVHYSVKVLVKCECS